MEVGCPNFAFTKNFALKRNLAKQKQFCFVSLQYQETTKKVSLCKFRFILLKKRFLLKFRFGSSAVKKVSLRKFHFKTVLWLRIRLDPELLPGSGSGIILPDPDPAKSERACK